MTVWWILTIIFGLISLVGIFGGLILMLTDRLDRANVKITVAGTIAITITLAFVMLAVCFPAKPKSFEGQIYHLEYHEEYTTTVFVQVVTSNGKTTTTTLVPHIRHYPDRWEVKTQAFSGKENKWIHTGTAWVEKLVFDTLHIGDWFVFEPDNEFMHKDEPYVQKIG